MQFSVWERVIQETENEKIRDHIAQIFEELGYSAIADEIRNERRARDNAFFALDLEAKREPTEQRTAFLAKVRDMVNKNLNNGTPLQRRYLELRQDYTNAVYLHLQKDQELEAYMDSITGEITEDVRDKLEQLQKERQELTERENEAKNKLDRFVFEYIR